MIGQLFDAVTTNCFGWHTWTPWEQYEITMPGIYEGKQIREYQRRQRRHCQVCNKEQDEKIRASNGER